MPRKSVSSHDTSKKNGVIPPSARSIASRYGDNDIVDLNWILETLHRQIKYIGAAVLIGGLLSGIYLLVTTPKYTSQAQILIDIQKPKIISSDAVAPGLDTGRYMIGLVIDSQVEFLRSRRIAERVIRKLAQARTPQSSNSTWNGDNAASRSNTSAAGSYDLANASSIRVTDEQIKNMLDQLEVKRQGLTLIIKVGFTDKNRDMAANIANMFVDTYLEDQRSERNKTIKKANDWLEARVEELRSQVNSNEKQIADYKAEHDLINVDGQQLAKRELLETSVQLITARANADSAGARLEQIEGGSRDANNLTAISKALQSVVIADFRRQYAQVKRKLATLVSRYGPNHQDVNDTKLELQNVRQEIDREVARLVQNLRSDVKVADVRMALLQDRVKELKDKIASGDKRRIELEELKRQSKATNELYFSFLTRLKQTQVQASLDSPDARVVSYATPPDTPSKPKKALTMLASLAGTLGLSIMFVLIREQIMNVIRTAPSLKRNFNLSHIASLPNLSSRQSKLAHPSSTIDGLLRPTLTDQSSQFSQSIFAIHHLAHSQPTKVRGHILAVVSAQPGEGKTTTAISIADYAAAAGLETLLIDCDLRHPALTASLAPQAETSLVNIVDGSATADEIIVCDENAGFDFCPGPIAQEFPRPMDVLASPQLDKFLQSESKRRDLIIIDTAALLPNVDARIMLDFVDTSVIIVECNKTSCSDLQAVQDILADAASTNLGAVLNKVVTKTSIRDHARHLRAALASLPANFPANWPAERFAEWRSAGK